VHVAVETVQTRALRFLSQLRRCERFAAFLRSRCCVQIPLLWNHFATAALSVSSDRVVKDITTLLLLQLLYCSYFTDFLRFHCQVQIPILIQPLFLIQLLCHSYLIGLLGLRRQRYNHKHNERYQRRIYFYRRTQDAGLREDAPKRYYRPDYQ